MLKYFLLSVVLWEVGQCDILQKLFEFPPTNITKSLNSLPTFNLTTFTSSSPTVEESRPTKIPDGYIISPETGSAHQLYTWKLSWNKARHACYSAGGHLVIINSIFERNLLLDMMEAAGVKQVWLGVHDLYEENDWTTVTDIPLAATGYMTWNSGEPSGNEHCVQFDANGRGMNDIVCNLKFAFVCEVAL